MPNFPISMNLVSEKPIWEAEVHTGKEINIDEQTWYWGRPFKAIAREEHGMLLTTFVHKSEGIHDKVSSINMAAYVVVEKVEI